ncbi:hypothetical protein BT96DRAFT_972314 [Gymnopus androsaceus JB14]|uniref:DUF6534 domain-containing protein n=1 Tax=Gymnopus androsaceus JB14 TaxID=1447944 RepID=A0A6A4IAT1_9AGAR|nr:hypothetical protein BT96DRAFT_972314 [Gymnopus androsaceus JB14]
MSAGLSAAEEVQTNLILGGVVVSNYLSYLTMGIVLPSTWSYFSKFPADRWWIKAIVILCVSICIEDTIGTGIWTYDWAVANYGNPAVMAILPWALPTEGFLMPTCGLTVQLFYAWRVWMMSMGKNRILPVVIGCLSILGWCVLCWTTQLAATHKSMADIKLALPAGYIWLVGSVGADFVITGSMIYYLDLRFRLMKPEFSSDNSANWFLRRRLRKLIVRTVECNILSLFTQVVSTSTFNRSSVGFYFLIPDMTLAKIYTFSLLVSLNSRQTDSDHETSEGGSSSTGREERGFELTVLHTSSLLSTQVSSPAQRETAGDLRFGGTDAGTGV